MPKQHALCGPARRRLCSAPPSANSNRERRVEDFPRPVKVTRHGRALRYLRYELVA